MTLDPLEILGVLLNLAYVILLIRQNILCWPMGILGSGISIHLFIEAKLYSEAILYLFYVIIGFYGWYRWRKVNNKELPIIRWPFFKHAIAIVAGFICAYGLGLFWSTQTDAERSFIDSNTTIFSFIASYMEANKVLLSWIYWVILNAISIWLYADRGLNFYGMLSVLMTLLSVSGFIKWRKDYQRQQLAIAEL